MGLRPWICAYSSARPACSPTEYLGCLRAPTGLYAPLVAHAIVVDQLISGQGVNEVSLELGRVLSGGGKTLFLYRRLIDNDEGRNVIFWAELSFSHLHRSRSSLFNCTMAFNGTLHSLSSLSSQAGLDS